MANTGIFPLTMAVWCSAENTIKTIPVSAGRKGINHMLSILGTVLLVAVSFIAVVLLSLRLFPRPLLAWADGRVIKSLDVEAYNRASPYSKPGFAPVHKEISLGEVRVEGTIPADFSGVYLRNGTNTQFSEISSRMHMFNGAGMLHQVQVKDGVATYSNSYVRTPRFEIERDRGSEVYPEFGDFAGAGKAGMFKILIGLLKQRLGVVPKLPTLESSSATTAIQYHHGKLYCLQETGYPFALDVQRSDGRLLLSGEGSWDDFDGKLDTPFTAHPKIDPDNGDWYTFSTDIMSGRIHYSVLSEGKLKQHTQLLAEKPALAFLHDYFLTAQHLVFPDLSLRFDSKNMTSDYRSPFYFDADHKMRFGVIKRDHSEGDAIQWFTTDIPGHIWHTINGWEQTAADGTREIVLYAPVYPSYPSTVPIHTPLEPHTRLYVFRLNLDSGEMSEQTCLTEHFYERPSFNTAYMGKQNRYAYLLDEEASGGIMGKGVMKYDLIERCNVKYFDYGDHVGGEALFVPKREPTAEDDGYLVDLLMSEQGAYLVIIDAATMTELAKLHLPQRVPYGVHGCWLNEDKLEQLLSGQGG
jgi:carotenoid 9,10(9',10')-cleavage dioxygenase 1